MQSNQLESHRCRRVQKPDLLVADLELFIIISNFFNPSEMFLEKSSLLPELLL